MILTFRADKMIARVIREGKEKLLDEATLELIRSMDGEPANDYNWASMVNGEEVALVSKTDKHPEMYVALCDCD